ncbi:MAG: glutamate-5-semialdehyde dehydrogenase, partial [Chthoniobacterales bacterium]
KNAALTAMAAELEADAEKILAANTKDIEQAEKNGLSAAMVDRLRLTEARLKSIAKGIRDVAALNDPVGEIIRAWTRPNGLEISKIRTPIGVIGIIYESRPNVTSDAGVLCLKTGNAVILRGGSEAIHSNIAIADALQKGGVRAGLPENALQLIPTTDRDAVKFMAQMDAYIDVIVPRGGHALIEAVVANARMPVIKHYHGVCHIYVDKDADFDMAEKLIVNSKCERPGVCNALETLLVHESVASEFLKKLGPTLWDRNVEIRGDEATRAILGKDVVAATEEDWTTEYLDLILSIRVVPDFGTALDHLDRYGSHHSDAIVTKNKETAARFLSEVDSATVYWNASTRFTDGAEFGFGAEIGISTDKLHARGPMALEELTTYKYIIQGDGQIR